MNLALVRHGPTRWNETGRFQGATDVPLSSRGRTFAQAIAAALQADDVTAIYSSDLRRALETAQIISQRCDAPVITDARLREFDFGCWEGLTWDQIVAAYPHLSQQGPRATAVYAPEGGETFAAVCRRATAFLDFLKTQRTSGLTVLVTHAGVLHALFAALGLEPGTSTGRGALRFTPAGVTRITMDPQGAQLISLDDVAHLNATP